MSGNGPAAEDTLVAAKSDDHGVQMQGFACWSAIRRIKLAFRRQVSDVCALLNNPTIPVVAVIQKVIHVGTRQGIKSSLQNIP